MIGARAAFSAALVILAACSPQAPHSGVTLNRGNEGEPKSLDPDFIDLSLEANIVGDLLMGLVTEDRNGEPVPGAATSWETSPDGMTWTFRIRDHLWSDGVPVTSRDFAFAWRRILDPRTAAHYAYNLWLIHNARAISDGRLPPRKLGVETPDDKTLIMHLEHPAPYLLQLLMNQTMYPVPEHVVAKYGIDWTNAGRYVSNGAYVLKEWYPGDHITLVRNPKFYDAHDVRIDTVNYFPTTDAEAALRRMRGGEFDMQNPLPSPEIDWLRAHMADTLRMKPYLGIWYMAVNLDRPPLHDIRIRKAISLSIDREAIVDRIYKLGDRPAYGMIPPGIANYPWSPALDFANVPYAERIREAQALMRAAGYGPQNRLVLDYETTTTPDNKRLAAAFQSMLKLTYIDVRIAQADLQVHFANMALHNFEIGAASWIADFNDASNFLDLLRWDNGKNNNYGGYRNPDFDALLDRAQQEADATKRGQMLRQAEQIAINDYALIPVRFLVTKNLVQPYVKGFVSNVRDFNRTRWLWIDGKPLPR